MKAITIRQPHASLLASGLREIETRGWDTSYRGPILIHASKKLDKGLNVSLAADLLSFNDYAAELTHDARKLCDLPWNETNGCVLAYARLADCYPIPKPTGTELDLIFGDFGHRRWGLELAEVVTLRKPVPAMGLLGLWTPDAELLKRITDGQVA